MPPGYQRAASHPRSRWQEVDRGPSNSPHDALVKRVSGYGRLPRDRLLTHAFLAMIVYARALRY